MYLTYFIKSDEAKNNNVMKPLICYFESTYIKTYKIEDWNYFNVKERTNNVCESFNMHLNNLYNRTPSFFRLLHDLKVEEDETKK